MASPRVCVLRAPGTNCDHETAFAFEKCGAKVERLHLFRILEQPQRLASFQILCIPGGFSYGDDVGAGVVFANQLKTQLSEAIGEFLQRDTLTLGICNGFQVLLKAGILPGGAADWTNGGAQESTLTWNANGRYTDLWVTLKSHSSTNVFLRGVDTFACPIAHGEGRLTLADPAVLSRWESRQQVALRYTDPADSTSNSQTAAFPINPNGSFSNIAGLSDPSGRVLGLMPHPERFLFATQHPQWTRLGLTGEGAGFQIFRNGVDYFC
jgi:phosphoribosylformylglycinamidine synthase